MLEALQPCKILQSSRVKRCEKALALKIESDTNSAFD